MPTAERQAHTLWEGPLTSGKGDLEFASSGIGHFPVTWASRVEKADGRTSPEELLAAAHAACYAMALSHTLTQAGNPPDQPVVEYTGGSTGSSLAFVCALKGHPVRIVSSDAFAAEKLRTMEAFGAEVELIHSPEGITPELIPAMVRRAGEIAEQTGAFWTDQFNNADMLDGYRRLGEELLEQLPGPPAIGAFCSYVGTAGCFLGSTRALVARLPGLHRVEVEPPASAVLYGGAP